MLIEEIQNRIIILFGPFEYTMSKLCQVKCIQILSIVFADIVDQIGKCNGLYTYVVYY